MPISENIGIVKGGQTQSIFEVWWFSIASDGSGHYEVRRANMKSALGPPKRAANIEDAKRKAAQDVINL